MKNFWQKLTKPFLVQAPMEDVTDTVFRQIIKKCGKPDVFFTEFTSTDGLCSKGFEKVARRLQFSEIERPIIAQIWGNNPENYKKAVHMLVKMGFDGIDINMGCPEKSVVAKGCCVGLINNPTLGKQIIQITQEAASSLPVSVKTRIGFDKIQTEEWIGFLLEQNLDAITIHGRTKREMSDVSAHWNEIEKAVKLRNQMKKSTIIIGNGDVLSYQEAIEKAKQFSVDGIMIGRGILRNPWIFNKTYKSNVIPAQAGIHDDKLTKQKLNLLIEHLILFEQTWGKTKNFDIMKKFYKMYTNGLPNATSFRIQLMQLTNAKDTIKFLQKQL